MFSIDLIELAAKVNDIQNEKLKYYLSLKDTNDIALKPLIESFNKNEFY